MDFYANIRLACSCRLRFSLGNSLASSFADARHRLRGLPRITPLRCPGNSLDVGSGGGGALCGAGAVHVCCVRRYRELSQVTVALLHLFGGRCALEKSDNYI